MKNVLKNFLMFGVMGLMSACSSLHDEQKNNEQSVAQLSKTQIYEDIIVGSKDVIAPRSGENEIYDIVGTKVVDKNIIIKPVVNTNNSPANLTNKEVKSLVKKFFESDEKLVEGRNYKDKSIKVLMENYKSILQTSYSCCVVNITEHLKANVSSDDGIIKFLQKDGSEYALQNMCVVLNDKDINDVMGNKVIKNLIKKSRNSCICNNAEFLRKNITNFYKIYNEKPELYDEVLVYRFKDKKGRIVEHDINETIVNISAILNTCLE